MGFGCGMNLLATPCAAWHEAGVLGPPCPGPALRDELERRIALLVARVGRTAAWPPPAAPRRASRTRGPKNPHGSRPSRRRAQPLIVEGQTACRWLWTVTARQPFPDVKPPGYPPRRQPAGGGRRQWGAERGRPGKPPTICYVPDRALPTPNPAPGRPMARERWHRGPALRRSGKHRTTASGGPQALGRRADHRLGLTPVPQLRVSVNGEDPAHADTPSLISGTPSVTWPRAFAKVFIEVRASFRTIRDALVIR